MPMTQGEAVFQAVSKVFAEQVENGIKVPETTEWADKEKRDVYGIVLSLFLTGQTVHKRNPSEAELRKYIPGLVNNWVRKDKRLNGDVKYEARRPGTRTGMGDEMLKNMKLLLEMTTDPEAKAQIEAAILERQASLKPKPAAVNVAALPPHLRHLVPGVSSEE